MLEGEMEINGSLHGREILSDVLSLKSCVFKLYGPKIHIC